MEITSNESQLTWGPPPGPLVWRRPTDTSQRTLGPKEFQTGSFEAVGGRKERQDFKVGSRRLLLVMENIEKNGGLLPTWMTETGVTFEQLKFVVADIEADAQQGRQRHGYLRLLLDGMGGEGGGYWAGEIGGMCFLFKYHEAIASGQTNQIIAFREAEETANQMLVGKREREGKNFGKASYLADLSLSDGHHLIWLGDVRGQVFENGNPRNDLRTIPHKPLFRIIPGAIDWSQERINAHPLGHMEKEGLFTIDERSVEAYISRGRVLVQFPRYDKPIVIPPDFLRYCFQRWRKQYSQNPMDARVAIPTPYGTAYINGFQLRQLY